jgi:hypothetical protein
MFVMKTCNSHKHYGLDDTQVKELEEIRAVHREREDCHHQFPLSVCSFMTFQVLFKKFLMIFKDTVQPKNRP